MTINTIDTTTPTIGLKSGADIINNNFTNTAHAASYEVGAGAGQIPRNDDLGTAAQADTGTAAGQVPTNSDLGTAAQADTGTATGQIPTADQLNMVGETNYTSANFKPEEVGIGVGVVVELENNSGSTINAGSVVTGDNLRDFTRLSDGTIATAAALSISTTWKNVGLGVTTGRLSKFVRLT